MYKDKKNILLKPFNNKIFYNNNLFVTNSVNNIFFNLKKNLKGKSIEVNTVDIKTGKPVDKYIYCDLPYPWEIGLWFELVKHRERNILFIFESPIINPFNHFKFLYGFFDKVYTWDSTVIKNERIHDFRLPQVDLQNNVKRVSFAKKGLLAAIFAKKSSLGVFRFLSPYKRDLYKIRLDIINFFEKKSKANLSLYGFGWNNPSRLNLWERVLGFKKYSLYKGSLPFNKKLEKLSQYKFSFVVENTSAPGYITEKIFDSLKAGCIPIYLGADNISDYIPKDIFIDLRQFKNYDDLLKFISNIDESTYTTYINRAHRFLNKEKTIAMWSYTAFEKLFVSAIS